MEKTMNQNICFNCGGECVVRGGRLVCAYCGSFMPERISGEETSLLYNAFQRLRLAEFTDAEQDFDDIIRRYPRNAQAYWGRLMARFGIKYEMDYDGRQIPTCYAASIDSITDSADYRHALEYADADTRAVFKEHAEYMERVRWEWTEKASCEKPYDIFISYKDSDRENGLSRTADSDELRELYIYLMGKGYRVFFSRESLRGKAGEKYEPYIYGALSTARVMLVYGSKPEYINATWVKNEWSRYLKQIRAGVKSPKSLLVAYKGFSPKELPLALAETGRQHLDAENPGFYHELVEAIERILRTSHVNEIPASKVTPIQTRPARPSVGLQRFGYNHSVLAGIGTCTDTNLIIPNDVRVINQGAFLGCEQLTSVVLPDSVTELNPSAFEGCTNLKSVTIGKSVEKLGWYAFRNCTKLESVNLPNGIDLICEAAFYCCRNLKEVTIPSSVTGIGKNAFGMCENLTTVRYKGTKKEWKQIHINLKWRAKSAIRTVECIDGTIKFLF